MHTTLATLGLQANVFACNALEDCCDLGLGVLFLN